MSTTPVELITQAETQLAKVKANTHGEQAALSAAHALLEQAKAQLAPPAPVPVPVPAPVPSPVPSPVPVPTPPLPPAPPAPSPTGSRVTALTHLGSFKVPKVGVYDADGFSYGGQALAFNPSTGGLLMAGFNAPPSGGQRLGEIGVPALGGTASLLQALVDPAEGKANQVGPNTVLLGGALVYNGALYFTEYLYYDGANVQVLTHFDRPLRLAQAGAVHGPYRVGPLEGGLYSGYMGLVDPAWVAAFGGPALTGNCDLGVISRTSYGPAVFAFDPTTHGPAVPLVYYDDAHQALGPWSGANPNYGGADQVKGVVMPIGTGSVLFFGKHGATFGYGVGTSDPNKAGQPSGNGVDPFVYDPADGGKGVHGYPYSPYVWAYNAQDLAGVAAGRLRPWDVRPYATWTLPGAGAAIAGAAYDAATGRIFVSEATANGSLPIVHVYQVQ